jgi:hypothetical protein
LNNDSTQYERSSIYYILCYLDTQSLRDCILSFNLVYYCDDKSNLTKAVIMALVTATIVISLISFSSCNAEAQIFIDNNNRNSILLTGLFTKVKQSVDTVNIAITTDPSNTITNVVPSLIITASYMHPNIDITGGRDVTPESLEAVVVGSRETRGFLLSDTTTAQAPAAKAGIQGGDILADIRGLYIEVSRIINIPKDIPNSSGSSSVPSSTNLTSDILTYQNSSSGIRIQYPANWTKDEQDYDPNDNITYIVEFNSPLTSRFDIYSETLAISVKRLSNQHMTLDEIANSSITDYNKTLTDFNLIESNTNITVGGGDNPAYRLIYTDKEEGINYKTMEIGTIIGDRVYYIEYFAEENKYSNYLPTIQMMINLLQIT